ncbi:hypothetical protein IAT40_007758 [Kwoniella sp. CBS 6097]
MPKNLLDLSDELLTHIASFTHGDTYIPIPSTHPHWLNLYHEFDQAHSQDYYNLRLVCKKLKALCPLAGLHCEIVTMEEIDSMLTKTPENALKGIRRLRVSMPKYTVPDIISGWSIMISLFQSLENLEELMFGNVPFCEHHSPASGYVSTESLRIPATTSFLPNLKALSIDVACNRCKKVLPSLLLPAAPRLEHLRMSIGADAKDPTYGPVKALTTLAKSWQKQNPDQSLPVKSLALRIRPSDAGILNTLHQLAKVFPSLKSLSISSYHGSTNQLTSCLVIMAEKHDSGWTFEIEDTPGSGLFLPLTKLTDCLQAFTHLKCIDCIFVLSIKRTHGRPILHTPVQGETFNEYMKYQKKAKAAVRAISKHDDSMQQAIVQVIQQIRERVPQLVSGAFWEYTKRKNQPGVVGWYRWQWKWKWLPNDPTGGTRADSAKISEPEFFTADFVVHREGARIQRPAQLTNTDDPFAWDSDSSYTESESEDEDEF